ncbi:hypothetical protein [Metabacillus arenae]|uniref:Uncharacterized protein n=1 Tax=Metabacillus arenae TaxID=2771434 RepID=A0A926ND77_9BACI|nr:hypothetical protein [Metabacillus arenae]MBD1382102.1 hypothetical protein [Metabacillus arenae]
MDILLENPLIVAAIIWVISAIFSKISKKQKEEQEKQRQPKPQKQSSPDRQLEKRRKDVKQTVSETNQNVQDIYTAAKERAGQDLFPKIEEYSKNKKAMSKPKKKRVNTSSTELLSFQRNSAIQGVIWSEILGEPKAKKNTSRHSRR